MKEMVDLVLFFSKRELKNKNQFIVSCVIPTLLMLFMGMVGNGQAETQGYGFPYMTFLLPGIVVMSFLATSVITFPIIIAGFKESGDLKRMLVTPISRVKLILSMMVSSTVTMLLQSSIIVLIAYFGYGVRFKLDSLSAILYILLLIVLSIVSLLSSGFLIAVLVKTQRGATTLGSTLNLVLPFLSGVYFPIDIWPKFIQFFAKIMPTTYIIREFRNLIVYPITENRGPIIETYFLSCGFLLVYSAIIMCVAVKLFRWE